MAHVSSFFCRICGKAVPIESCKTDEHGKPVHEGCYFAAVSINGRKPPAKVTSTSSSLRPLSPVKWWHL